MAQPQSPTIRPPGLLTRIARGALWLLFAVLLLVPKLVALRRRPRAWNVARVIFVAIGVALILADVTVRAGTVYAVLGTALALIGLSVKPVRSRQSLDDRARQLGALVVVNGGTCRPPDGVAFKAHLCAGADRVWLLDPALAVRAEVPLASLAELRVQGAADEWKVLLLGAGTTVELAYAGSFAEHFARVAESTVRSQLRRDLPVLR